MTVTPDLYKMGMGKEPRSRDAMGKSTHYDDVEVASTDDLAEGVRAALTRLGLTLEQLAAQADRDDFQSEEARLVWFMIAPLDGARC